jgi:hypothetical protein
MNSFPIPSLLLATNNRCSKNPIFLIYIINSYRKKTDLVQESYNQLFSMCNEKEFTIPAYSSHTVGFPCLFITALPTLCVLTCDAFAYTLGLSHGINIIPSNDAYPHITLFNYSNKPVTVKPRSLRVFCQLVITGQSINPMHFH